MSSYNNRRLTSWRISWYLQIVILLAWNDAIHGFLFIPRPRIQQQQQQQRPTTSTCSNTLPWSTLYHSQNTFTATSASSTTTTKTTNIDEWLNLQFWRKPRTKEEIEHHVVSALESIPVRDDSCTKPKVHVLQHEPVLLAIDNFLSKDMCQSIIQAAESSTTLQRSTMGTTYEESMSRTSDSCWLKESQCEVPLRLLTERVARVSGVPPNHMENLQVVRYLPGQEFTIHTDHLHSFNNFQCRGRLATCLIYLQEPMGGGETRFFEFKQNVNPRQGTAVFFWNTMERPGCTGYDPEMFLTMDLRLRHAGLPVLQGEKWICNRWMHPVEVKTANVRGLPKQSEL
mmetsp:Transcript_8035/g.11583  ORF Transcript_8035/g.11583 Transcript_8035/m.11583 type:complete len:342 (+) Transcript_8035:37-1062(+)